MSNEEFVSFRLISDEMHSALQGEKPDPVNFYQSNKDKMLAIFKAMGVDIDALRKPGANQFEIPVSKKELLKELIGKYSEKRDSNMGLILSGKFKEVSLDYLQSIIFTIEEIFGQKLELDEYESVRDRMYLITRYPILRTVARVREQSLDLIKKDIEGLQLLLPDYKRSDDEKRRLPDYEMSDREKLLLPDYEMSDREKLLLPDYCLSDGDKLVLLDYYRELLTQVMQQWKDVARIVEELRLEEILRRSEDEYQGRTNGDEVMDDSLSVLLKAIHTYRRELEEIKPTLTRGQMVKS